MELFRLIVKPGTEAVRYPVKMLRKSDRSLIMFPSGSRHSSDVKGGVAVIAKTAKLRLCLQPVRGQDPSKACLNMIVLMLLLAIPLIFQILAHE